MLLLVVVEDLDFDEDDEFEVDDLLDLLDIVLLVRQCWQRGELSGCLLMAPRRQDR